VREFSLKDLKKFNGIDKNKTYIAHDGQIYDVTGSFLWKGGKHQVTHFAGRDLTEELGKAPHGVEFLKRFPVIGTSRKT
jgi:predicted heme/steroid binding protein